MSWRACDRFECTTENFIRIGHSLFALLAGWLGSSLVASAELRTPRAGTHRIAKGEMPTRLRCAPHPLTLEARPRVVRRRRANPGPLGADQRLLRRLNPRNPRNRAKWVTVVLVLLVPLPPLVPLPAVPVELVTEVPEPLWRLVRSVWIAA